MLVYWKRVLQDNSKLILKSLLPFLLKIDTVLIWSSIKLSGMEKVEERTTTRLVAMVVMKVTTITMVSWATMKIVFLITPATRKVMPFRTMTVAKEKKTILFWFKPFGDLEIFCRWFTVGICKWGELYTVYWSVRGKDRRGDEYIRMPVFDFGSGFWRYLTNKN